MYTNLPQYTNMTKIDVWSKIMYCTQQPLVIWSDAFSHYQRGVGRARGEHAINNAKKSGNSVLKPGRLVR